VIPTPPTPEFPSGHAIHAEAILELLRRARGGGASAPTKAAAAAADSVELALTSPLPLPVVNQNQRRRLQEQGQGEMAPVTRTYKSLSEVSEQLAVSRVNAGLHYRFTADISVKIGQAVARKVWGDFDKKHTAFLAAAAASKEQRGEGGAGRRRALLRADM
jgi:hypothetical protein